MDEPLWVGLVGLRQDMLPTADESGGEHAAQLRGPVDALARCARHSERTASGACPAADAGLVAEGRQPREGSAEAAAG